MDLIYLDNAATSFPKPEDTYVFMDQFYRTHGVNPGRSGFDLCMETGQLVDDTRKQLCRFFGGTTADRLVFSYNSTDAINLALFGLLQAGDHAITTTLEHNAVLRPLYHLATQGGVEVDHVPFDSRGFVDPEAIRATFRKNTKVVAVNHASNVIGTVQPVGEIGRLCRERGIHLVVDASQTAGKIPIDVEAMGIDVLCFTGHKSLMGPTGIGGMYVADGAEIRHTRGDGNAGVGAVFRQSGISITDLVDHDERRSVSRRLQNRNLARTDPKNRSDPFCQPVSGSGAPRCAPAPGARDRRSRRT
jgi:selenocysteine lyase/cysteine desulfurase